MTMLSNYHQSEIRYPIYFCLKSSKVHGENAESFKSYVVVQGTSKVNILIDYWSDVSCELKRKM